MRTLALIESDIACERAALRRAREMEADADAKNDESAYDNARGMAIAASERIDALRLEASRAQYVGIADAVDTGAFSPRFQSVDIGGYWAIADVREHRIVESGGAMRSVVDARAREMCHFSRQREAADELHTKPINLATRRR